MGCLNTVNMERLRYPDSRTIDSLVLVDPKVPSWAARQFVELTFKSGFRRLAYIAGKTDEGLVCDCFLYPWGYFPGGTSKSWAEGPFIKNYKAPGIPFDDISLYMPLYIPDERFSPKVIHPNWFSSKLEVDKRVEIIYNDGRRRLAYAGGKNVKKNLVVSRRANEEGGRWFIYSGLMNNVPMRDVKHIIPVEPLLKPVKDGGYI